MGRERGLGVVLCAGLVAVACRRDADGASAPGAHAEVTSAGDRQRAAGSPPARRDPHHAITFQAMGLGGAAAPEDRERCTDPPPDERTALEGHQRAGRRAEAWREVSRLAQAWPRSVMVRLAQGAEAQYGTPPRPREAIAAYEAALRLHESGCAASDHHQWLALEGIALAQMGLMEFQAAVPWLRRAVARWPTANESRYNLACSYCRVSRGEDCYREFATLLETSSSGAPPAFEHADRRRDTAYWIRASSRDADLVALRADPRYPALVARYGAAGQR